MLTRTETYEIGNEIISMIANYAYQTEQITLVKTAQTMACYFIATHTQIVMYINYNTSASIN